MDEMELLMKKMLEEKRRLFDNATPKPFYDNFIITGKMLPMSDGILLATYCFLPQCDKKTFPTIFVRSCYPHQKEFLDMQGEEYSKRGFAYVYQWCRGTGASDGVWEPNVNDRQDGLDTLNWLAQQDFVENIGYMGDSYLAMTGWCMADAVPEKVKTMFLGVYGTDRFVSAYKDGLFRQDILTSWAMGNAGTPIAADQTESYKFMPQKSVDEKLWGVRLNWYRDWISNTQRNDPYWQQGFWKMLKEIPSKIRIPLYIKEGWYDHHLGSALVSYADLSPESRAHSVLKIGPWNHGYQPVISHQCIENLVDDSVQAPLSWFTEVLMEKKLPEQAVYTYVIGEDRWQKSDSFPLKISGFKEYFLSCGDCSLSETASADEASVTYTYDPNDPVPAYGGESLFANMDKVGSLPQSAVGERADVVSFVSEPIGEPIHIGGSISVELSVSSSADDTAFYAKLMEVFPDGTAVNIRGSITTLGFRNGNLSRVEYTPGSIEKISINMWDINWKIGKGSKIRLDISSSYFPEYSIHSNNAGIWSQQTENKIAEQTLHTGGNFSAKLRLPVIE